MIGCLFFIIRGCCEMFCVTPPINRHCLIGPVVLALDYASSVLYNPSQVVSRFQDQRFFVNTWLIVLVALDCRPWHLQTKHF